METAHTAAFAEGTYRFWLPLPQVFELERGCEISILALEERLRIGIDTAGDGSARFVGGGLATVRQIREVVRLGLIGGNSGMVDGEEVEVGPLRARELVDSYTYPARPLEEGAALAWMILSAAIFGVRLKKKAEDDAAIPNPSPKAR